jgi:dTDP-3-amino-2,3,6-trideoxy-4-keto-D-glucose/dTDP-3-amino-3,4,6-trideoxy-alpha-D-glucose/dTDP-2,6-dideoxy-D-kanosamine transaminase
MDEIQAAVLLIKLKHLDDWNKRRRAIVLRYREAAGDAVIVPDTAGIDHVAHLCVVRSPQREALRQGLTDDGIATDIHYPVPDHRQPALQAALPADLSLPQTDKAVDEILTLPCFPELTDAEVEQICESLARFGERAPRLTQAMAAS